MTIKTFFFPLHSDNKSYQLLGDFYPQDGSSVCVVTPFSNVQLENHNMFFFFF